MQRFRLIVIIFSLSLNGYGSFAYAATQAAIGTVISMQGQVVAIDQANQRRTLERRATIYLHDRIVTGQDSKVQLVLKDNSVIVVQASSEFYVSEFYFNQGAPRNNKYVGNLVKGMLLNISGQGDTKNYQLNSPLTTIAFRGTGIATKLISKNKVLVNQDIYVFQGYVTVSNRCENAAGACMPRHIDIGVGQQVNSATVNMVGNIQTYKGSGLLSATVGGGADNKVVTKEGSGGGITIRCK